MSKHFFKYLNKNSIVLYYQIICVLKYKIKIDVLLQIRLFTDNDLCQIKAGSSAHILTLGLVPVQTFLSLQFSQFSYMQQE